MALIGAIATLLIAWRIYAGKLGLGLFAIHDDEDVAEAKGVPTLRYKLIAFALSAAIAGAVGGIHAMRPMVGSVGGDEGSVDDSGGHGVLA